MIYLKYLTQNLIPLGIINIVLTWGIGSLFLSVYIRFVNDIIHVR